MELIIILFLLFISILFLLYYYKRKTEFYKKLYENEKSKKTSLTVKHGKLLEHFIPWIKKLFPYPPERFRFIGDPIDGILFGDDKILFLEFKTGGSKLNQRQKQIKSLVERKKIEWEEVRLD